MDKTDLLFRCEGNSSIGAGHVMRCISIADAALSSGRRSTFLTASDDFSGTIAQHGHACQVLQSDYRDMNQDMQRTKDAIRGLCPKALLVDSYYVTEEYLSFLFETCRETGTMLVYLDDVLSFPYPCDVLMNYNIYGPDKAEDYRQMYRKPGKNVPRFLLGPSYAPLRAEFQNLPLREIAGQAGSILISTGGADAGHTGIHLIREMIRRGQELARFHFHFIVGAVNEDAPVIRELAGGVSNITLHSNVQRMAELMCACDLAISAAGSTLYELCATQTPAVTYILADNQIPGAEGFARHGVLKNCGDIREIGGERLAESLINEIVKLADDRGERILIARKQRETVDGMGAARIVSALFSFI